MFNVHVHQQFFLAILFFFFIIIILLSLSSSLFTVLSEGLNIETNVWLLWKKNRRLTLWVNTQTELLVGFSLPSLNIFSSWSMVASLEWLEKKTHTSHNRETICNILVIPKTPWIHIHTIFRNVIHLRVWRKWADYVAIPLFRLLQNRIE